MERIPWQIVELHLNDVLYLPLIPHSSIQEKGNEGAKSMCIRNEQCGLLLKQIQDNSLLKALRVGLPGCLYQ